MVSSQCCFKGSAFWLRIEKRYSIIFVLKMVVLIRVIHRNAFFASIKHIGTITRGILDIPIKYSIFPQNKFIPVIMLKGGWTHIWCLKYQALFPFELKRQQFLVENNFFSVRHFGKFWISSQLSIRIERIVSFEPKNTPKLKLNTKFGDRKSVSSSLPVGSPRGLNLFELQFLSL